MTSFANIDNSCFLTFLSTVLLYSFMMVPTRSGYEGRGGGSESNLEEVHVSVERVQFLVQVLYCLIRLKQQMWLFFNALVEDGWSSAKLLLVLFLRGLVAPLDSKGNAWFTWSSGISILSSSLQFEIIGSWLNLKLPYIIIIFIHVHTMPMHEFFFTHTP